mgnify:FL=1
MNYVMLLGVGGVGFLVVLIIALAFMYGKKKATPDISEMLDSAVDISETFKKKLSMGESVSKDFIQNLSKKGTVEQEKRIDVEIPQSEEFVESVKENLGVDIDEYLEDLEGNNEPHKLMYVSRPSSLWDKIRRRNNGFMVLLPEKMVRYEDDEKLVLHKNVDLEPDDNDVWTPSTLSSTLGYQKVAYQDLWGVLLNMMSENMRHIQHFNIKHSQDVEKLELSDNDGYGNSIAGDVNKFGRD